MYLESWIANLVGAIPRAAAVCLKRPRPADEFYLQLMTLMSARFWKLSAVAGCFLAGCFAVSAQTNYYQPNGTEYAVVGSLPGDQVHPDVALSANGGMLVWQDNVTDGEGFGISARRLDSTVSGTLSTFRVNVEGANDQQNPRVAMLKNGGAAFVWQGGPQGYQHIYGRFMTPSNTWMSSTDLAISASTNNFQVDPAIAVLNNSNVVVVWSSFDQAGANSLLDVYAKILSPDGTTVKPDFLVNQFTDYNQRSAKVTALKNGGFVVAWISEQERVVAPVLGTNSPAYTVNTTAVPSVDVYARIFQSDGIPTGNEFLVNQDSDPCANPSVAAASNGGFMIAWSRRDMADYTNGWDVFARPFSADGTGGESTYVNTHVVGNQYAPQLASIGKDYLVAWTSMGQDGSREGVYGRFVHADGVADSGEFRVNTTTVSQQMQPTVASDGNTQFVVVWTTYTGSPYSFELYAQRYISTEAVLQPMPAPFVYAPFTVSNNVYQPQLQISWAPLLGISVSNYEVYVDGATTPAAITTSNVWVMTAANGLTASSKHSFQVNYVTTDGRSPNVSPAASGTTWSSCNYMNSGVPCDWVSEMYGTNAWPYSVSTPLVPGGPTLVQVFLSGGDPLDSSTWLHTSLVKTAQGFYVQWNSQPGFTYQVQSTTNFVTWKDVGSPRFAAGTTDSIFVGASSSGYYRVYLLR